MHELHSTKICHKYFPSLSLVDHDQFQFEPREDIDHDQFQFEPREDIHFFPNLPIHQLATNIQKRIANESKYIFKLLNVGHKEDNSFGQKVQLNSSKIAKGRKNSWHDMPKFILAGAVSTVISRTFVAPLERIKLECIVQGSKNTWLNIVKLIWVSEGLRGFWKGNTLNLFRMVPFKSINFILYDMYLDHLSSHEGKEITYQDRLIGGGISGLVATVACIPLDTIRTRLIAPGGETLGGISGCILHMMRNEGYLSLYKGLTPALLSMGPSSAVFYSIYDALKSTHISNMKKRGVDNKELGVVRTLIYGAIAGACAETVVYPLEVIRRQLQLQHSMKLGLGSAFIMMIKRDGVGSLYAGLFPSTLQVLPSAALSYLFYEMMKSVLQIS